MPTNTNALELTCTVKNLGAIEQGSFTQKPLTLFCGPNNSGKTWAMYLLYHCYKNLNSLKWPLPLDERQEQDSTSKQRTYDLKKFNNRVSDTIPDLFNTSAEKLQDARFDINDNLTTNTWQQLMKKEKLFSIFLMPAERNGLNLFFRELSTRRTALLHHVSKENIDINELLRDVIYSRYAKPIADYIDWLNNLTDNQKTGSGEFHTFAETIKKKLANGKYTVEKRTGKILFQPYQTKRGSKKIEELGLHMTSSTVKSLFGLWFYLEYQAKKGDILMIDEPELNIHPENQRKIARLLAQLVNAGLNIVISTHSSSIVREFNSMIMLNQDKDKALRKKHKYDDSELLNPQKVAAYLFDQQTIEPFEIIPEDGIYATTFDKVIRDLNTVNDDIYYSLQESRDASDHD